MCSKELLMQNVLIQTLDCSLIIKTIFWINARSGRSFQWFVGKLWKCQINITQESFLRRKTRKRSVFLEISSVAVSWLHMPPYRPQNKRNTSNNTDAKLPRASGETTDRIPQSTRALFLALPTSKTSRQTYTIENQSMWGCRVLSGSGRQFVRLW